MPRVFFTDQLQRFIDAPAIDVSAEAKTLRQVLEVVFTENPQLKGYLLDDQGAVRRHVVIFVAGTQVRDRENQADPVNPDDEIYVIQALSGG